MNAGAAVVALPGNMQATASGTVSLPGTVTVTASAVADLTNNAMLPLSVSGLTELDDLVTMNASSTNDGRSQHGAEPRGAGSRFERGNRTQTNECTDIVPKFPNTRFDAWRKQVGQAPKISHRAFEQSLQPNARVDGPVSSQSQRNRNSANSTRVESTSSSTWKMLKEKLKYLSLTNFAKCYYGPWLQKFSTKVCHLNHRCRRLVYCLFDYSSGF